MRMRTQLLLAAGMFGLAMGPAGADAQVRFPVPANSLSLEETGTLAGIQGNYIKFHDSNQDVWLLQVVPQTTISIEGEADADYLRRGLTVVLTAQVNEDRTLAEPIKEIEVISGKGRPSLGLFPPDEDDANAKPVRKPEAGKYRIRGKLASFKKGELLIVAGRWKITGTAGEELKVKLTLNDARMAQFGDEMTVKAWYLDFAKAAPNRLGRARAEAITIKLTNPPLASGRRSRSN